MAALYPPIPEYQTDSERMVVEQLRHDLDESFRLYPNLRFLKPSVHEGEADVVVLHPELGLCVVEVKGHGVSYEKGRWYRHYRGTSKALPHSPFHQAAQNQRDLAAWLHKALRRRSPGYRGDRYTNGEALSLPTSWMVVFPMLAQPRGGHMPPDADPHVTAWQADMKRLGQRVQDVMQRARAERARRGQDGRLTPEQFEALHTRCLMPELRSVPNLSLRMKAEHDATVLLDSRQLQVLDSLEENARYAVVGGAGTGKSLLAQEAVRRMCAQGHERVLYLCFNRRLAANASSAFGGESHTARQVDVRTFHQLCHEAARRLGRGTDFEDAERQEDVDAQRSFYEEESPELLLDALAADPAWRWDAVVIDEGQDLREGWWVPVEALVRRERESPFLVFFDPDQAIFGHESCVPRDLFRFRLMENYRNPRLLAHRVCALTDQPLRPHPWSVLGEEPVLHAMEDRVRTLAQLQDVVSELRSEGVKTEQIAILTPHRLDNPAGTLHGVETVAGLRLSGEQGNGLLHSTISGFKGLDREVILLLDIDPDDPRCSRRDRYVAASRARQRLFVWQRGSVWQR